MFYDGRRPYHDQFLCHFRMLNTDGLRHKSKRNIGRCVGRSNILLVWFLCARILMMIIKGVLTPGVGRGRGTKVLNHF